LERSSDDLESAEFSFSGGVGSPLAIIVPLSGESIRLVCLLLR
jgi:hypothetical protein